MGFWSLVGGGVSWAWKRDERYEREGKMQKQIPTQQLWFAILDSQVETSTPYMLFKDACYGKSNQRHLGTIESSNFCTEIIEYTSPDEIAVCNLASINLTAMVVDDAFDFKKLRKISNVVTRNLNKVIDVNYYPARRRVPSRRRRDSSPSSDEVGGLIFDSESVARRCKRPRTPTCATARLGLACKA